MTMLRTSLIATIVLFFVISLADDKNSVLASLCHYNLSSYNPTQICSSIHLFGNSAGPSNYSECRILNGSLTLRELDIAKLEPFTSLEIIVDFVVFKNISSSSGRTLREILPRLRMIAGRCEILYYSLFVINYMIPDNLQLPSLENVCGNIMLERSSGVCFPHSQTYWNILANQTDLVSYEDIPALDQFQIHSQLNQTHFYGTISVPIFNENAHLSVLQNHIKKLRLIAYQIDSKMFELFKNLPHNLDDRARYVQEYVQDVPCYEIGWNRNFAIGNLWNIEEVGFIENGYRIYEVLHDAHFPNYPNRLMEPRKQYSGNRSFIENSYDILRINVTNHEFEGFKYYNLNDSFQYGSYYILKVMFCTKNLINSCKIHKLFLFHHGSISDVQSDFKLLIVSIILLLILSLVLFICLKIRSSRKSFRKDIVSFNPEYTPLANFQSDSDMRSRKCCEIDKNRLVLNAENLLGKGQFGYVYEGVLNDYTLGSHCVIPGNEEHCEHEFQEISSNNFGTVPLRVAIKQLKSNVNDTEKERFLLEANIMRNFESEFLVKLIGVCSIQEPVMVVMEFMQSGDLKRFLTKCQHDYKKFRANENIPSRERMLEWALQISDGMFYLHSKQVIHRDLATRNCMLTKDLQIKIGDFGLTRHVFGGDYYRLSTQVSMPLRWMAPESLQKMIFTPKTDVWSYGVVLWEIMSLGKQPYKGIPDELVKELICGHTKLQSPPYSCAFLWDLTKFCWSKSPSHRPSFETIVRILLPRLSPEAKARFAALSYIHKVCSVEEHQESVDSRTNRLFSRAWDMFYQNFFSRPDSSSADTCKETDSSFYSRYRRYRTTKHYPSIFVRSNSNSSGSSGTSANSDMNASPDGQECARKISYDSVYSSATQDYSSDSK